MSLKEEFTLLDNLGLNVTIFAMAIRMVTGDLEIATSLLSLPDQVEINSIIRTPFQKKI